MQSYSQNAQTSNIFGQIRAWRNRTAQQLSNREVDKIASLRNDKSHSDEALIVVRIMLVIVTLFTAYCGYLFYQNTFSKIFSPTPAFVAAIGLGLSVELAKVFLSHRALRSIFFGWMFKSGWTLGGWGFIFVLGIGAFAWSVNISTDGMDMLTREFTEQSTPKSDLSASIAAATVDVDRQITFVTETQKEGLNTKWKNTTTRGGQKIAASAGESLEKLQEQRQTIVDQVTADHRDDNATRRQNISNWAYWIDRYGGYMELVGGFCLLAIVFFECRLVSDHLKDPSNAPTPSTNQRQNGSPAAPSNNGRSTTPNGSALFNNAAPAPLRPDREGETLTGNLTRTGSNTDDDFIKLRLKELRGWSANFGKSGNRPDTVAGNLCRIYNDIGKMMQSPDFRPSADVMLQIEEYSTKEGFRVLETNGYQYPYEDGFLTLCKHYINTAMAA